MLCFAQAFYGNLLAQVSMLEMHFVIGKKVITCNARAVLLP
jgi:hypothetical protein